MVLTGVDLSVEGGEERSVTQVGRPDHGSGPHEPSTEETSHGETDELGAERQEDDVAEAPVEVVEDVLDGRDVGSVGTLVGDVRHDSDNGVLLDVERTGVEGEAAEGSLEDLGGEDLGHEDTHRVCEQLGDERGDGGGGVSVAEQLVDTWITMVNSIPRTQVRNVMTGMVGSSTLETAARTSG